MVARKTIGILLFLCCVVQANAATTVTTETSTSSESVLESKLRQLQKSDDNPLSIALYRPSYVLPFNYTSSPYNSIYQGNTPNGQSIMHEELKAQLSLIVPVVNHFFADNTSLNIAYTQLSYWQVYASSQYFRETNYEPEIVIQHQFARNWLVQGGVDHQSNGRGGALERSWNRVVFSTLWSGPNWMAGIKIWDLIFKEESSNLHNPDIAHYLGYDAALFSYKFHSNINAAVQVQNLESGLSRGSVMITFSYPLKKHFSLYCQLFHGYGESLIEYNHKTNSVGLGIAFNDWV